MTEAVADRSDQSDAVVLLHKLPREVTSWRLAGLTTNDGRAYLRCEFEQEVGGVRDPQSAGSYKDVETRNFTVHWELASLKEFMRHLITAATEIERRVGGGPDADIVRLTLVGDAAPPAPAAEPETTYHPGYL